MSSPGPVEHVPLQVVPMIVDAAPGPPDDPPTEIEGEVVRIRRPFVGIAAAALAVLAGIVHGVAIGTASAGDAIGGTTLAWVAIGLSGAAVLGGITAAVAGWGRRLGIAAAVLGLAVNPWLLLQLLTLVGGLGS